MTVRSGGYGQRHIGGGYHPVTERVWSGGDMPDHIKTGVDCLICHSRSYDIKQRFVVADARGQRWNQDRSMKAAMTVGLPTRGNCLFCHQYDMGENAEQALDAASVSKNRGVGNRQFLRVGDGRGVLFNPENDVHAAAGFTCTDCHLPKGHEISLGKRGMDKISNNFPDQTLSCESCHTNAPHVKNVKDRALLNGHVDMISCETCHIIHLGENNVVLRDWIHPVWNEKEGMYFYSDIYRSGAAGKGFRFLWFNGSRTFLNNALGDNPLELGGYDPLMRQLVTIDDPEVVAEIRQAAETLKRHYPDLNVDRYVEEATHSLSTLSPEMRDSRRAIIRKKLRPVMKKGKSRIHPFKVFNAIVYEDMNNQGPFGAMVLPFDGPTYHETGDPMASVKKAVQHPIVKQVYEISFKKRMMDGFIGYLGFEAWKPEYPLTAEGVLQNVEAHWMRQMATFTVNHGIRREGHPCTACHSGESILDFEALGYPPERVRDLLNLSELE